MSELTLSCYRQIVRCARGTTSPRWFQRPKWKRLEVPAGPYALRHTGQPWRRVGWEFNFALRIGSTVYNIRFGCNEREHARLQQRWWDSTPWGRK